MRKQSIAALCPCGSQRAFAGCCGPYLAGTAAPPTAEALMRSRYTAYSRGDAAYLLRTWHPATRPSELAMEAEVRWFDLQVLATSGGQAGDDSGTVHFCARYKINGKARRLEENSRFARLADGWYYLDGEAVAGKVEPRP